MFQNYLKSAWRSIWKNKTTTIINIGGLSVGMTAAVLILLWVQNETSFDKGYGNKNIYRLTTRIPSTGWVWESTPLLLADAIKKDIPGIEKVTRLFAYGKPVFNVKGNLFYGNDCAHVDDAWFDMFRYHFTAGSASSFNDNPFSVILSQSEANKYFGGSNPVGQIIHIDTVDYQVRGVVSDAPLNSSFQYKVFMPINALLTNKQIRENDEQWSNDNYISFVQLAPGSNPAYIAKKISSVRQIKSGDKDGTPTEMIALSDMHFENEIQNSAFVHGNRHTVYIFSFLGFLLLLIACINYVNLTTAKASLRAKEVSIRKITGATRTHLFMQFVAESVLISLLSLGTTLLLINIFLPAFNILSGQLFSISLRSLSLWKVLGITLLVALILNSIYPALLLSSFKPMNVFRGKTILRVSDRSFRRALVVLQFTISVILIAGTIIIYRQMQFIQKDNPGYNRSQALSFMMPFNIDPAGRISMMQAIKQDLLTSRHIENVATASQSVVDIGSACTDCADWAGHDTSYKPKIAQLSADADFLQTMQLQMKEGRWFRDDAGSDKKSFILNETAVKDFNLHLPATGQLFVFKGDTGQVIGVVKDFTFKSMHEKKGPLVIWNNVNWRNQFVVRASGKNVTAALAAVQQTWKKFVPSSPLEYNFLDDRFNNLYKQDQQTSLLIFIFAVIAIAISSSGLFSLAAFEAAQRTKEIGIRKVLGATVAGIASLLSKEFVKLVCLATLLASPITWWAMSKWLQDFAYRINIGWWVFAAAGALAMFIALCTISFQAVRAAMANPVKSLSTE